MRSGGWPHLVRYVLMSAKGVTNSGFQAISITSCASISLNYPSGPTSYGDIFFNRLLKKVFGVVIHFQSWVSTCTQQKSATLDDRLQFSRLPFIVAEMYPERLPSIKSLITTRGLDFWKLIKLTVALPDPQGDPRHDQHRVHSRLKTCTFVDAP